MGYFNRSEGHLFPYSHFEIGQKVSPVHYQQQSLPIASDADRPYDSSLGAYHDASYRDFFFCVVASFLLLQWSPVSQNWDFPLC